MKNKEEKNKSLQFPLKMTIYLSMNFNSNGESSKFLCAMNWFNIVIYVCVFIK